MKLLFPILLAMLINEAFVGQLSAADSPSAESSIQTARRASQRVRRLRRKQLQLQRERDANGTKEEPTESDDDKPTRPVPRFQMMKAGDRIVILDNDTGETRVIEPAAAPLQNIEIGRAWVVVTVLGRVTNEVPENHTSRPVDDQSATP